MGRPVVVGRKTYLSFSRKPLPGRTNIVVSRDPSFAAPGALVASNLAAALEAARGDALRRSVDAIMVVGGADLYAQTLPLADRLEITRVHANPEGDTHLPPIDPHLWREVARREQPAAAGDSAAVTFVRYMKLDHTEPKAV
jgi:dihydrofolate reductase